MTAMTPNSAERAVEPMREGAVLVDIRERDDAWKKAGLPVTIDRKPPIPTMRQVQLAAGSFAVLGAAT